MPLGKLAAEHAIKDPKGGLTAAGRAHFKRTEGANLKPGVKGPADTPEKMRRKGSFLSRMFGPGAPGAMTKDNGEPSRRALSARAWGEPVPKNDSDRAALYAKGQRLLERYKNKKEGAVADPEQLQRMRRSLSSLFEAHGLPPDSPHMIFAGAGLYGHGLRDKFDDIDIYVPGLKGRIDELHDGIRVEGSPSLTIQGKDIGPEALKAVHQHPAGLSFMSPEHILMHKRDMNRPKDQKDIAALEQFLSGKVAEAPPWEQENPKKKSKELSDSQKAEAKRRARAAGRPYPNLVDNMAVSKKASDAYALGFETALSKFAATVDWPYSPYKSRRRAK